MTDVIKAHSESITALCRKYDVKRLDLFGSALENRYDSVKSDLDFVVEFNNFSFENAADRYFGLLIDLEDLFKGKVDLVSYRAIKNPYFKQVVDTTRVLLYAA